MSIEVKICGLKTKDAVLAAAKGGAKYLGFVFYEPSPRNVEPCLVPPLLEAVSGYDIKIVAVVVNPDTSLLDEIFANFRPDFLQLHGEEPPEEVQSIKNKYAVKVIKAFSVMSENDVEKSLLYEKCADMYLFDTKVPGSKIPGGNGVAFDWQIVRDKGLTKNWFLSGGINAQNVETAVVTSGTRAIDASSSLESTPGVKDMSLIESFLNRVKEL